MCVDVLSVSLCAFVCVVSRVVQAQTNVYGKSNNLLPLQSAVVLYIPSL
jgi:hypothetical protein